MEKIKNNDAPNTAIAVVSGVYMVILTIGIVCVSIIPLLFGGFAASATNELSAMGADAEVVGLGAGFAGASILIGVALLVLGIALLVAAVGVFMKKPWAYLLTIGVNSVFVILTIINLLSSGFDVLTTVLAVICAIIIFLFYTDAGTKAAFGR